MKWNFFYDETEGVSYHSLKDWYREIRYLVWPAVIIIVLMVTAFLLVYIHAILNAQ
ncbi:hypothetical protein [Sinomicrobium sp. M5D2P9]